MVTRRVLAVMPGASCSGPFSPELITSTPERQSASHVYSLNQWASTTNSNELPVSPAAAHSGAIILSRGLNGVHVITPSAPAEATAAGPEPESVTGDREYQKSTIFLWHRVPEMEPDVEPKKISLSHCVSKKRNLLTRKQNVFFWQLHWTLGGLARTTLQQEMHCRRVHGFRGNLQQRVGETEITWKTWSCVQNIGECFFGFSSFSRKMGKEKKTHPLFKLFQTLWGMYSWLESGSQRSWHLQAWLQKIARGFTWNDPTLMCQKTGISSH